MDAARGVEQAVVAGRCARPRDIERLTGRIVLLLEQTAHQGLLALRLLVQARELSKCAGTADDVTMGALVGELEARLMGLEREGRRRLRRARRVLRLAGAAVGPETAERTQRPRGTRSVRSQR